MAVFTIQFTQEQARRLVGISSETLRHWRTVTPYLRFKKGKAARFGFTDLVGLCAMRVLVGGFGVQVARMAPEFDALFRELGSVPIAELERLVVVLQSRKAVLIPAARKVSVDHGAIVVACGPIVEALRESILPVGSSPAQRPLPLPPRAVRS